MRKSSLIAVSGVLTVASLVACSKKEAVAPQPPTMDGGIAMPPPGFDAGAPVTAAPADAGAPSPLTGLADAGAALADTVADTAIDVALAATAAKVAPKMDKEGVTTHTTVKEGDHFGMVVTLQPGRCYTIVGVAPPGSVSQLDLKLLALPLNNEAGRSSAADKATPVIGKGTAALCPVLPVAMPYKVDAAATKGAGRIGIQVYSRAK